MTPCRCCEKSPVSGRCRKYCKPCGDEIRAAFKGKTREEYRAVIRQVRERAQRPQEGVAPRDFIDSWWEEFWSTGPGAHLVPPRRVAV